MENVDKIKEKSSCCCGTVAGQSEVASNSAEQERDASCCCCAETAGQNGESSVTEGCCSKSTERTDKERTDLIHRLNRIAGQVNGIRNMLERNAYCVDILLQVSAVTAALNSFNKELLSEHIHHCVARDLREGKEETLDELIATVQKLMR